MSVSPQEFDFDAWLDGAERPERSVTVYQKAGLIADLDALEEQIKNAEEDESGQVEERRLGEATESQKLRAEYAKLAQQFHDSALVIRLHGHDDEEKREFAQANKGDEDLAYIVLADAITSMNATPKQVRRLKEVIGQAQFGLILAAYHQASTEVPAVSADFLPKPSTQDDGGE